MQALFLLDSNDYIPGGNLNEYDYIHEDQVAWYEKQVRRLSEQEGYTIPSMLFFHIPLQEYKEAYELYEKDDPRVTYYYGEIGETMIDKICCSQYPLSLIHISLMKLREKMKNRKKKRKEERKVDRPIQKNILSEKPARVEEVKIQPEKPAEKEETNIQPERRTQKTEIKVQPQKPHLWGRIKKSLHSLAHFPSAVWERIKKIRLDVYKRQRHVRFPGAQSGKLWDFKGNASGASDDP